MEVVGRGGDGAWWTILQTVAATVMTVVAWQSVQCRPPAMKVLCAAEQLQQRLPPPPAHLSCLAGVADGGE